MRDYTDMTLLNEALAKRIYDASNMHITWDQASEHTKSIYQTYAQSFITQHVLPAFHVWRATPAQPAPSEWNAAIEAGIGAVCEAVVDARERARAVIALLDLKRGGAPTEYERKVAQMKKDFPNGI